MLIHSSLDDEEARKKILLEKIEDPAAIKSQLKALEDVNRQMSPRRTYAEVMTQKPLQRKSMPANQETAAKRIERNVDRRPGKIKRWSR